MLNYFLSQDIVERQISSDGHQQSRQSDLSLSVEKESTDTKEKIETQKVCINITTNFVYIVK